MENNINNIDDFFKNSLDGHESSYVPGAWENMEAMLDADNNGYLLKNIHRYIIASVVGTIILAGSVVAYISGYDANTTTYAKNTNTKTEQKTTVNAPIIAETETSTPAIENNTNSADGTTKVEGLKNTPSTTSNSPGSTSPNAPINTKTNVAPTVPSKPTIVLVDDNEDETPNAKEENTQEANLLSTPFNKQTLGTAALSAKVPMLNTSIETFGLDDYINSQKVFMDSNQRAEKKINDMQRFYRLQFGIQAGGNFNKVLSNTSSNFQVGSGLMAGLFFSKNLNRHWAINAELNYLRSSSNAISRTITQTEYFLEKTTTNYLLITKSFDYLQLPIAVSYAIAPKHKISLGAVGMYMINAKTDFIENKERFADKSTSATTKNGIYEDLTTFNYGIAVGYEYKLPGMYSFGLRYNQMLRSVSNTDNKQLPAHLQLVVKLNLTR